MRVRKKRAECTQSQWKPRTAKERSISPLTSGIRYKKGSRGVKKDIISNNSLFTGIVVIPAFGVVEIALIAGGIASMVGGLIKVFSLGFGFELPIVLFGVGRFEFPIALGFVLALILGFLLTFFGRYLLKLTRSYLGWVFNLKENMIE